MEGNRDEASRCIELTKLHIKKKDLDSAWKFSVKANKLYPTCVTKRKLKYIFKKLYEEFNNLLIYRCHIYKNYFIYYIHF